MGADSLAENTPDAPEFICLMCLPNLSAQAQKFWISMKKGLIGRPAVRSPWVHHMHSVIIVAIMCEKNLTAKQMKFVEAARQGATA